MKTKLLFLTLNTFSATGGIEKVCRVAAKAFSELAGESGGEITVFSMYDGKDDADKSYLPSRSFTGFSGRRIRFSISSLLKGRRVDTVLLSHVNLLPVGYLIKKISPKTRLVLMAHGIEVWNEVGGTKQKMLRTVDLFLPVSSFTANKLREIHGIQEKNIRVLNNCLDPYLKQERNPGLEKSLRQKYGIRENDVVFLTVTRLKYTEQYKGYDKVVKALANSKQNLPNVKYLIVGKWDEEERQRLDGIVHEAGLTSVVVFAGFAKDEELSAHFSLSDAYIMPSTGEGFGIVFIEALFYGLPVIAGNVDGSVDALAGGEFGLLVNPGEPGEIEQAIQRVCHHAEAYRPSHPKVMERFGFDAYKNNLRSLFYTSGQKSSPPRSGVKRPEKHNVT